MSDDVVQVSRASAASALALEPDGVTWVGAACATTDAPVIGVRVTGEVLRQALSAGDARAVDAVVGALAIPGGLLDAMAEHCVELDREHAVAVATGLAAGTDLRWRQALAIAIAARGAAPIEEPFAAEPAIAFQPAADLRVSHVRALPGGTIAVLEQWSPYYDDRPRLARLWWVERSGARRLVLDLVLARGVSLSLLTPTVHGDPASIVLAARDDMRAALALHAFAADGTHAQSWLVKDSGELDTYSRTDSVMFLHGHYHHVAFDAGDPRHAIALEPLIPDSTPASPRLMLPRDATSHLLMPFVGRFVAVPSPAKQLPNVGVVSEEIVFCDLALREPPTRVPLGIDKSHLCATPDALWLCGAPGVYRANPQNGLERVIAEPAYAVLVGAGEIVLGTSTEVVWFDLASRSVQRRTTVGHLVQAIVRAPGGGVIASTLDRFTWLDAGGAILATSLERRGDVATAMLADGTLAVSAGLDLLVIGPDGTVRRRLAMPFDGRIAGATATHFLYSVISSGWPTIEPDALYAIDGNGHITSRVSLLRADKVLAFFCPARLSPLGGEAREIATVIDEAVLLLRYHDGALLRWDLSSPPTQVGITRPAALREMRDVQSERYHTSNPRDEWAEAGLEIAGGSLFASACTFGGTTGVSPGPAITIRGNAVATLFRCRLSTGERSGLAQASTAIFIECQIENAATGSWQLDRDCHLVLLDCTIIGALDILAGAGSSVVAPGHEVVRSRVTDQLDRVIVGPRAS